MTHLTVLCFTIAVAFFLTYLQAGRDREALNRCYSCGALYGEKHHRDCQWGDR